MTWAHNRSYVLHITFYISARVSPSYRLIEGLDDLNVIHYCHSNVLLCLACSVTERTLRRKVTLLLLTLSTQIQLDKSV
jgi:hypothetical protein